MLAACGSLPLPDKPQRPIIYDFGPGLAAPDSGVSGTPLALAPVEAPANLEGQAVTIDAAYVDVRLGELSQNEDLSRYIL